MSDTGNELIQEGYRARREKRLEDALRNFLEAVGECRRSAGRSCRESGRYRP